MRVETCGVCGTDVHIFRGEYLGEYPVVPGHEASGVIEAVGEGVTRLKAGMRVAVEPNIPCGHCDFCLRNEQNFCRNWTAVGVTRPGAFAEYTTAPEAQFFDIGDLSFEEAAFMEPLSCVLHGLERVGVTEGDHVLILGAGPIGLLLLQAVSAMGAERVTIADRIETRLEKAGALGACPVNVTDSMAALHAPQITGDWGFDLVIEAAGVLALVPQAIDLARPGGRVLLFGVAPSEAEIPIRPFEIFRKGLHMVSSYTSLRNSVGALEMLQSGRVKVKELVSHRLPLEDFEKALELLANPEGTLKIQLRPGPATGE